MVGVGVATSPVLFAERSGWVAGATGGFVLCEMGSMWEGPSTLPLCTKTLAWGLATMTRGDWGLKRPDEEVSSAARLGAGWATGRCGTGTVAELRVGTGCEGAFCGKRGVVFAVGGAPVRGGAEGLGATGAGRLEESFDTLGIGLVTAVDHAGGTLLEGAGSNWVVEWIGRVVAAETFGRGVGVIFPVAGLSGRGGRLIRSVSRLGAFGSLPSGVESAIVMCFYSYFLKCSMAKFAIITDL
jgi:hypothetical protein